MDLLFISQANFGTLVERFCTAGRVLAPVNQFEARQLREIKPEETQAVDLSGYRTVETLKAYGFKISETVARYFGQEQGTEDQSLVILGARGCDLEGLEVLDRVFTEGELKDGFYSDNRSRALVIGADCTAFGKTCFCTMMGGKPFPQKMSDIDLSPLGSGYLAESKSAKGEKIIAENSALFSPATNEQIAERDLRRAEITEKLEEYNCRFNIKHPLVQSHKLNLENKAWRALTKDCVECSACNFICPTCSCFLLLDEKKGGAFARDKIWDACLKAGYTRVAGGANPRGKVYQRLQNRYHCKCDYSFDRLGRYTCVGCGRCIDACAGNIDMRKIFSELQRLAPLTAKLE